MIKILYGKPVAEKIYQSFKISKPISMAAILVGEDPASLAYIRTKEKKAKELNIDFRLFHFSAITLQTQVVEQIKRLGEDENIQGIIVQLPLPKGMETEKIIDCLPKNKDIDGFRGEMPPPTAQAILEILKYYNIDIKNKKIVIIGYGRLVGKPLTELLRREQVLPVICDSSSDIGNETIDADIIISAAGVPGLITADMVSRNAVVIDAGTAEAHGEIHGDVDPGVNQKVRAYTPSPGGVGPVTVACLMRNLVEASKK